MKNWTLFVANINRKDAKYFRKERKGLNMNQFIFTSSLVI